MLVACSVIYPTAVEILALLLKIFAVHFLALRFSFFATFSHNEREPLPTAKNEYAVKLRVEYNCYKAGCVHLSQRFSVSTVCCFDSSFLAHISLIFGNTKDNGCFWKMFFVLVYCCSSYSVKL